MAEVVNFPDVAMRRRVDGDLAYDRAVVAQQISRAFSRLAADHPEWTVRRLLDQLRKQRGLP
jgi:hypothetical protein